MIPQLTSVDNKCLLLRDSPTMPDTHPVTSIFLRTKCLTTTNMSSAKLAGAPM